MIGMHHIVTQLELVEFLQTLCNLTTSRLITLKVIFMETVKYLMVSKQTYALLMVNETFVYCLLNSSELNVVTPIVKNSLDTFCLFFAIATDKQTIAISHILL